LSIQLSAISSQGRLIPLYPPLRKGSWVGAVSVASMVAVTQLESVFVEGYGVTQPSYEETSSATELRITNGGYSWSRCSKLPLPFKCRKVHRQEQK
jgi:hypothetical protein